MPRAGAAPGENRGLEVGQDVSEAAIQPISINASIMLTN
jgi:hypothetical protein